MTSSAFDSAIDDLTITTRKEIVFIEDNVADIDTLVKGIGNSKEIVILDSTRDGLHQIAETLAGRTGIDALHVIAHGREGAADFGALQLNGAKAGAHSADLQAIGRSMAPDGDILLYGCNIGAGDNGAGFLETLAIATGADVAASNNLTGSAALGGDWELEVASGSIETQAIVNAQTAALYQQVLSIASANIDFHDQTNFVVTSVDTSKPATDTIYKVNGNAAYQLVIDGKDVGTSAYAGTTSFTQFVTAAPNAPDASVTIRFGAGQIFTATSISIANYDFSSSSQSLVIKGYDAAGHQVGATANSDLTYGANGFKPIPIALTGMSGISSLKITATTNSNLVRYLIIDDLSLTNIQPPSPKVIQVTSPTANATYKIGDQVDVQVNFDSTVDVTGTPQLTLETGTTDRVINYVSGSGTSSLTFRYTVQAGDVTADLDYKNSTMALNGGAIKSHANAADAELTLPTPGGVASLSVNKAIVIDGIAPALTITSNKSLLGASDTAIITFTFSEDPGSSFTAADITASGGTLGTLNGSSGLTRTATFTPNANGTATISVASGTYADAAGNVNSSSSNLSVTVDTVAPTVAITSNKSVLKAGDTAAITFTFTEDPGASFTWNGSTGDVVVSGGTLSAISGSGTTRTATFTPSAALNGVAASITVTDKSYADAAGNRGAAGTTPSITIDTVAPTVTVSSDKPVLKAGETATITFTFSEDPGSSFAWDGSSGDIAVSGGTLSAVSGSGTTRTATFTPNANTNSGSATVSVNTPSFQDAAGNSNSAGGSTSITYDTQAPTLTISSDKPSLKGGETATITFTFSEDPGSSFDNSDITISGGTLSAISGSGTTRTATFTPTENNNSGTASITVTSSSYTDAAGNAGGTATSPSITFDTVAPAAPPVPILSAGSDSGASNSDKLTNNTTPTFTGTAEAGATVKLYDSDGATQIGIGMADGTGAWLITTSAMGSGQHTITAKAFDTVGNASAASSGQTVTIDTSPPVISISSSKPVLKADDTATITFTFSEDPGSTFTWDGSAGDVTMTGGTLSAISGTGTTRTATFTANADFNGTASVSVAANTYTDAAGNNGSAGATPSITIDSIAPLLNISSDKPTLKAGQTATITFTFSEDPGATFTWNGGAGDIAVSGGTLSAISGSGLTRTAIFTPTASINSGTASITVSASSYTDAAGNSGGAGITPSLTFDTLAPNAPSAPALAAGSDTGTSSSDNLTKSTTPTLAGTAEAGATVKLYDGATLVGTGTADAGGIWTITSNALAEGDHTISATAIDAAGNTSAASTGLSITVDATPPATTFIGIAISADTGSSTTDFITKTAAQTVTATLSAGLAAGDILYGSFDGSSWTDITGKVSGTTLTWTGVTLAAGTSSLKLKVTDAAGNDGTVATQAYTLDTTAPATTIASAAFSADTGASASDFVTRTAAQTVSGTLLANLAAGEAVYVSLDNGATWNAATATVGQNTWSLAGQTLTASNTLKVKVTDTAGNDGTDYSQTYTLDTSAPAFQSASVNGATLVMTYSDAAALDAANVPAAGVFAVAVGGTPVAVNSVTVNAANKTVTLTLATAVSNGQTVTVAYTDPSGGDDANAIQDTAGNDAAALAATNVTNNTPAPPSDSGPPTTAKTSTVDGVLVNTQTTTNTDGSTSHTVTIPVVEATRQEQVGNNTVADIPLLTSGDTQLLSAQLPIGFGLQVSGSAAPKPAGTSVTDLIREIQSHTDAGSSDQTELTGGGSGFLTNLPTDTPLLVQTIVPSAAPSATGPSSPLVISGTPAATSNPMTALVIDTRGLPSGSTIQLQNVEFAAVIGEVRLTGGEGSQHVYGDSASQYMVLGPDDDELHGGGGNDTVGSEGGNDRLFGDDGNDRLFGGAGQDLIAGGNGNDTVVYTRNRADYVMERNGNIVTVRSLADPADADTLVNVEKVQFADGAISLEDATALASTTQVIAGLYAALYGRAPDSAGLQYWIGRTGEQGTSLHDIATMIANTAKFDQLFSSTLATGDFVSKIYQHVLGIAGDAAGRAYWAQQIDAGVSRTDFVADFVTAALNFNPAASTAIGNDLTNATQAKNALANKVAVGLQYASVLAAKSDGAVDSTAYQQSVDLLAGVTADSQSIERAVVQIDLIGGHTGFGSAVAQALIFS